MSHGKGRSEEEANGRDLPLGWPLDEYASCSFKSVDSSWRLEMEDEYGSALIGGHNPPI